MSKPQMRYFEEEDILHLCISEEREASSVEVAPNITAELNDHGELIGIEILSASNYIRDAILDSVQAKILELSEPHSA